MVRHLQHVVILSYLYVSMYDIVSDVLYTPEERGREANIVYIGGGFWTATYRSATADRAHSVTLQASVAMSP